MRVWLSPRELAARGLTAQDVENAIRTRSVEIPAGRIESDRREFSVRYLGEMRTPSEFADLTVASGNGELVKLGDVARVEPGPEDERSVTRYSRAARGLHRRRAAVEGERARGGRGRARRAAGGAGGAPARRRAHMAFDGSVFVAALDSGGARRRCCSPPGW